MTMKKLTIVLLGMVTLVACKKEEKNQSACDDAKFSRSKPFTNSKAQILPEIIRGEATGDYVINNSETITWKACNLPQSYQVDSLRVNISGYYLYFEGMEDMNLSSLPVEVTQIENQN